MSYKYIMLPVSYIPEFLINHSNILEKALNYGIANYASRVDANEEDIINHLIYSNYQQQLPPMLSKRIGRYYLENFGVYTDYRGFLGIDGNRMPGASDPENVEYFELLEIISEDQELYEMAERFFKFSRACDSIGVIMTVGDRYILSFDVLDKHKGEPHVSCKRSHIFEYSEPKTEKEIMQFMCYLAIRSIIGTNRYRCGVTYKHILSRLMGFSSAKAMPNVKFLPKELKPIYRRFYPTEGKKPSECPNRARRRKLLEDTCEYWNLLKYSDGIRGHNISLGGKNAPTLEELIYKSEARKPKNKLAMKREEQRKLKEKVLSELLGIDNRMPY